MGVAQAAKHVCQELPSAMVPAATVPAVASAHAAATKRATRVNNMLTKTKRTGIARETVLKCRTNLLVHMRKGCDRSASMSLLFPAIIAPSAA